MTFKTGSGWKSFLPRKTTANKGVDEKSLVVTIKTIMKMERNLEKI